MFGGAVALALAGCAAPPDLAQAEAVLAAAADPAQRRVPATLAATAFGTSVTTAVQGYPALGAGDARIMAARAAEDAERGAFIPQVGLGAEATTSLRGGGSRATPFLRLTQLVYDGGAATGRRTAARARLIQSHSEWMQTAAALTLEAVEVYHGLISQRALRGLAQENLAAHRRIMDRIADRVAAGAGSEADILTGRSRLADAVAREVEAQSRLERAEASFREIFGAAPGALAPPPPAPDLPGTDEALVSGSPRVHGLDAALHAALADLAAARAARFPALSIGATGRRDHGGGSDVGLDLSLSYDLGTQGQRAAAIAAAEARVAQAEAERATLAREIRRSLDFVRSDQRAGRARLAAAREAVAANRATVAATDEQFAIGRRSLTDLLEAQRDLLGARERLIAAEQELAITGYAALALTGDILHLFAIPIPAVEGAT